jgi:hypothetical protein
MGKMMVLLMVSMLVWWWKIMVFMVLIDGQWLTLWKWSNILVMNMILSMMGHEGTSVKKAWSNMIEHDRRWLTSRVRALPKTHFWLMVMDAYMVAYVPWFTRTSERIPYGKPKAASGAFGSHIHRGSTPSWSCTNHIQTRK